MPAEHTGQKARGRPKGAPRGARTRPGLPFLAMLIAALAALSPAWPVARTAHICDQAAEIAARRHSVPIDVLLAITRTETGRGGKGGLEPWPWTVNMEGAGRWFATEEEARAFVFRHFQRGARSFDVGCFQINYKWHGAAFRSIDDMFDPVRNAEYAARFLADLHTEFGDWSAAAGAYHSRTPTFARAYSARFERIRRRLSVPMREAAPEAPRAPSRRRAEFGPPRALAREGGRGAAPFIGSGGSTTPGSLVPLGPVGARPFLATTAQGS